MHTYVHTCIHIYEYIFKNATRKLEILSYASFEHSFMEYGDFRLTRPIADQNTN